MADAHRDVAARALRRRVQPHGPARGRGARRLHGGRLPARRAARRPARRRAAADLARRAARAGARLVAGAPGGGGVTTGELRALGESVAREAGALLREAFRGPELRIIAKSTPTDLVSEADHAAEHLIRERLSAARPDDGVLGEEGGDRGGTSGIRWIVDPLDGTINFLFGVPQWAVSIACEDGDGTLGGVVYDRERNELFAAGGGAAGGLVGVVYDPERNELFAAERGAPATLDGRPIAGSTKADLATALI